MKEIVYGILEKGREEDEHLVYGVKGELIHNVQRDVREIFPITSLYLANIPTYPSGLWAFTIGSKKYHPLEISEQRFHEIQTKYYTKDLHKAAFILPKFVQDLLK